jgi:methionine synthase II (cobalamin-independent)
VSVFAAATGVGSWPGTAPRPATEVVVGELPDLPHLVELPARGVGADMIGRAAALLIDIALDTVPRGYRVVARPGAVTRRAVSLLDEDLDALQEVWERAGLRGGDRAVKLQAPGPITLAAQVELPSGHRAITDEGAVRDLAASLAEGLAAHRAQVSRRLDGPVVVQLDEPSLSAALAGRLTGVTGLTPVHPVDESVALGLLDDCVAAAGGEVALHTCAPDVPWKLLQRSIFHAVSIDASEPGRLDLDGLGEFVDAGRTVMVGVVPMTAPPVTPSAREIAATVAALTDRLGLARALLAERIGVMPTCGLAGATPEWARTAIDTVQKAAEMLADDPEGI